MFRKLLISTGLIVLAVPAYYFVGYVGAYLKMNKFVDGFFQKTVLFEQEYQEEDVVLWLLENDFVLGKEKLAVTPLDRGGPGDEPVKTRNRRIQNDQLLSFARFSSWSKCGNTTATLYWRSDAEGTVVEVLSHARACWLDAP